MDEIRYIIIAKQCEVAGKLLILDGCHKKSFTSVYDLGKRFLGHPSRISDFPCNLTQFCNRYKVKIYYSNRSDRIFYDIDSMRRCALFYNGRIGIATFLLRFLTEVCIIIRNTGRGSRGNLYSPRPLIVTEPEG